MTDIDKVQELIEKGKKVLNTHRPNAPGVIGFPTLDSGAFSSWKTQCLNFIESILPPRNAYVRNFRKDIQHGYTGTVKVGIGILQAVKEDLESGDMSSRGENAYDPVSLIKTLCERFHLVARQIRSRHDNRGTLDIQDEYDVQDLFHALLHLFFEDIRPEERTPSYAGKSSRMDFLLKREQVVVEIKKTRQGLDAKELGSQLIEDINRYKVHPDCDALFCFVYDPEGRIANPRGIENDLRRPEGELKVEVLIRP